VREVSTVHADDELDVLFDTAGREGEALAALDGAVSLLRQARDAKQRLARLDAATLREQLLRRSETLGGDPA
jgi:hypothetical protein